MKQTKLFTVILAVFLLLTGCGGPDGNSVISSSGDGKELVIYSPNTDGMINVIIPMFEQETGVEVELVKMGSGDMFNRVESELNNPKGDVAWGGSFAAYLNNLDYFEPYTSKNNSNAADDYQNKTGKITPYCLDGSCLLVNKDLTDGISVEGYEDLLNPALKGKIAFGDPENSSSAFAQLTNMLLAMGGGYTSADGWDYVEKLLINIDGVVMGSSSAVHKSVAEGEYSAALTYEDPAMAYIKDGAANVSVVYPKEGAVFLPSGSAIIKGAKNMENAKKFMDFLVSKQAQDAFGTELTVRPVSKTAAVSSCMTHFHNINLIYENTEYVKSHKSEIISRFKGIHAAVLNIE